MSDYVLTIGNRNYSSWSLRAWLVLKQTRAPFTEDQVWLDEDLGRAERLKRAPTGKVPVLRHGERVIWDSLAIAEYLAEQFPIAGLWPPGMEARARARAVTAEMHAGFPNIREQMPMNCRVTKPYRDRGAAVGREIKRVIGLWEETRARFGRAGAYLFGELTIADAFYAPVASRFKTYGVPLEGAAASYAETQLAMPAMQEWVAKAGEETHSLEIYDSKE
jgi:glutathione S-transferase